MDSRVRGILWAKSLTVSGAIVMLLAGKTWGQGTLEEGASLYQQVVQLYQAGRYQEAIPLAERALAIREKVLGPDHPDVATDLNNLALLYKTLGDYGRAEPLYQSALAIYEKALGPDHPDVATSLNNLAALYDTLGDYGRAEPLYQSALAIDEKALGSDHPTVATSLNNLALLYYTLGDYGRAEPLYQRALAIKEKALGSDHPNAFTIKGNIGMLYLNQGKLEQAYKIFQGYKGDKRSGLGRYYLLKGDYQAAQEQFREAVEYRKKTRESVHLLAAYIGLGLALEGLRQDQQAADAYQQAVALMEEQRAALTSSARTHFLEGEVGAGFKRILAYEGLVRVQEHLHDSSSAFFWAENTKARLLLEAVASRASGERLGLPEALARQEVELSNRIAATYKQQDIAFAQKNLERVTAVEQELARLKQQQVALITRLRREYPTYAALRYPQPLKVTELRLEPEEVLIEYEVTEKETFAWLIKRGKVIKASTIPITRKALTEQVKRYRGFFDVSNYSQLSSFDPRVGKTLYDLLLKDFAPLLKDGERIIIVPDEILGILPFETLVVELPAKIETATGKYGPYPQRVKYLGDVYSISYYQSATALTLVRTLKGTEKEKKERLLVVADPVFDLADARLGGKKEQLAKRDEYQMGLMRAVEDYRKGGREGASIFPRLENTGQLPERLKPAYGTGVDVLSGLAASEPELKKRPLKEYGSLVFATHGILDDQVPYIQEPALVLSQVGVNAQERDQDGFLTMSEVMGLKLNAEVAALTACNTGVGKNLTGEGVMGLGRAFQYAGAKTVLMSLWSVQEESTTLLTEKFFTYLHEGKDKLEALRLARADMRQAGYEHPFFWAPFILVGER